MRSLVSVVIVAVALAGCSRAQTVWIRADGQPVTATQLELDRTVCLGEAQKANVSGVSLHTGGMAGIAASMERASATADVGKGCMAQRGYLARIVQNEAPNVAAPAPVYAPSAPAPVYAPRPAEVAPVLQPYRPQVPVGIPSPSVRVPN